MIEKNCIVKGTTKEKLSLKGKVGFFADYYNSYNEYFKVFTIMSNHLFPFGLFYAQCIYIYPRSNSILFRAYILFNGDVSIDRAVA